MSRQKHKIFCYECNDFLVKVEGELKGKIPPAQLAPLVRDLGLLMQSWSVMAGRNLMNDVLRGLQGMEATLSPKLKTVSAQLRKKLTDLLQTHVIGKARYDTVVCLGYRVKTSHSAFQGATDDYQDMQNRCEDLKAAIRSAHNLVSRAGKPATDGNVLKIFMAPEFYFRGRNGAYEFGDVNGQEARKAGPGIARVDAKSGILELMQQEIAKPIYKDWLFVLGTAICATKVSVCQQCKAELQWKKDVKTGKSVQTCTRDPKHAGVADAAQIDNVAFVWKEGAVHTMTKELVSHIDFKMNSVTKNVVNVTVDGSPQQLPVLLVNAPSKYTAATAMPTKFQDERMGGSIFTIDGVTFGLEVCLDHAATTSSMSSGRLNHAGNIQVQLIPSAGMDITTMQAVDGGIIFNVDGATPHVQVVAGGPKAQIRYDYVAGSGTEVERAYPRDLPRNGNWDGVAELSDNRPVHLWKKVPGAPKETPALPKVAHGNSGSVLLYGPYELPAV